MDHSIHPNPGQQKVIIDRELLDKIKPLCDFMQMLRDWWEHFEDVVRKLDRVAAMKAYDIMIEGVILARQIARQLGFELPDPSTFNWAASPRPQASAVDL
jgi:hypothetical protein